MKYKEATEQQKREWRKTFCTPSACDKSYLCCEWDGMEEECFELHQEQYPDEFKEVMIEIFPTLDNSVECCTCTRQQRINGTAWIYCEIYNNEMLKIPGFDETGETSGCSEYEGKKDLWDLSQGRWLTRLLDTYFSGGNDED